MKLTDDQKAEIKDQIKLGVKTAVLTLAIIAFPAKLYLQQNVDKAAQLRLREVVANSEAIRAENLKYIKEHTELEPCKNVRCSEFRWNEQERLNAARKR